MQKHLRLGNALQAGPTKGCISKEHEAGAVAPAREDIYVPSCSDAEADDGSTIMLLVVRWRRVPRRSVQTLLPRSDMAPAQDWSSHGSPISSPGTGFSQPIAHCTHGRVLADLPMSKHGHLLSASRVRVAIVRRTNRWNAGLPKQRGASCGEGGFGAYQLVPNSSGSSTRRPPFRSRMWNAASAFALFGQRCNSTYEYAQLLTSAWAAAADACLERPSRHDCCRQGMYSCITRTTRSQLARSQDGTAWGPTT